MTWPRPTRGFGALAALLMGASPSAAQLPGAGAAVLGTADAYTALARGFSAVGLNPAGLGMPDNPGFSLAFLPFRADQTLDPLTLADLADYGGRLLPASVKEGWLQEIASAGGQTGGGRVEVTALSFNAGRVGLQISTVGGGRSVLNDDAAELLLFGNAGRTGTPRDMDLSGSEVEGFAVTTLGIAVGLPLSRAWGAQGEHALALGATAKYSVGHALALGQDAGSVLQSNPLEIEVAFPTLHSDPDEGATSRGSGVGLDLGAAWASGPWQAGAAVKNLFHTFEWRLASMVYRPGEALFNGEDNDSDFEERPASEAPVALRDRVAELTFRREVVLGGAYRAHPALTLTAEAGKRFGDGLDTGPESRLGVGLEYRPAPFLPLWGGVAAITDGYRLAGGMGLFVGPVQLSLAGSHQGGDAGTGTLAAFSLSFGGR